MAAWVTFGGLKGFVDRKTKELIVPSKKKLAVRKTEKVVQGRFGKFRSIKVVQDGRTVFMTGHDGVFEDMTIYPVGGILEGHDLSVINRRIVIRWDDDVVFCIDDKDTDVKVYVNDEEGVGRGSEWNLSGNEDDITEISVFMDGTVLYEAGGRRTTFSLCKCRDHRYKSVTRGVRISEEELAELSWDVRLTMFAEERLEHNSLNHKKEIDWSSDDKDDDNGDGDVDSDKRLWSFFMKEYQRQEYWKDLVGELLLTLDEMEEQLIRLYFFEKETQKDIADELGVTRETVSRRINRILRKMEEKYKKSGFKDHTWGSPGVIDRR